MLLSSVSVLLSHLSMSQWDTFVSQSVYIPNPLRCYQCQKFGHGRLHCKGQQTCARCGETAHDDTQCQKAEHCVNCDGNHAASSKACPKWKLEQRVQQIRAEKNLSFIESRKLVVAEQQQSSQTSLASVVSSSKQQQFKSVKVQTVLSWPSTVDKHICSLHSHRPESLQRQRAHGLPRMKMPAVPMMKSRKRMARVKPATPKSLVLPLVRIPQSQTPTGMLYGNVSDGGGRTIQLSH